MKLRIISGRSGAGKSALVRRSMVRDVREGRGAVLIVPDQYTFDAERELMESMGGGLLGAQVLGFTRLAERVLAEAGGHTRAFLSHDGKRMALRKVIEERKGELTVYKSVSARSGFADQFCDLIAGLKYAAVSPGELREASAKVGDELLRQKLGDIATLYEGLGEFMAGRYIDAEDMQALLVERISQAQFLRGARVYVDALPFYLYKTQTYRIIERLLTTAETVSVTIRCGEPDDEDAGIFLEEAHVGSRLAQIAHALEIPVEYVALGRDRGEKREAPPAVMAVERYLFAPTLPKQEQNPQGITLYEAPDRKTEVEAAVARASELLRSGARLRDIAFVLGEPEAYQPLLRREFSAHGYAAYLDEKRPLASHPVVELMLSSMHAALRGFRRDEVLRALKSGLTVVGDEMAEVFEAYCLRFGVSFGGFLEPFVRTAEDFTGLEEAETARLALIPPIEALAQSLRRGRTARAHATALYDYLCALQVRGQLDGLCRELEAEGRFDEAAENAQVYNAAIELIDQVAELMDGEMTAARFASVIEEGCAAHEIGVIPASTDQLLVSDVERVGNRSVAHMIVLGCVDGAIPRVGRDDGILNAADRAKLLEAGCTLDADDSDLHERQIVYACLSRATESLTVCWPLTDGDGKQLSPSFVADRLRALFPKALTVAKPLGVADAWCERKGFSKLVRGLRELCDACDAQPGLDGAYAYFAKKDDGRLGATVAAAMPREQSVDARRLYGAWKRSSVTRVETFNACPFKHMVQYGLRPAVRREYRELSSDEGRYYHAAFDEFVKLLAQRGIDWADLDDELIAELLEPILDELERTHNDGVLGSSARARAAARRMRRTATRTLLAVVSQIQAGEFRPLYSELAFGFDGDGFAVDLGADGRAALSGVIDRVDVCGGAVRVIDYKSGNQGFGFDELWAGLKLQLPLYMLAAIERIERDRRGEGGEAPQPAASEAAGNGAAEHAQAQIPGMDGEPPQPAGMFYLQVDDPILDADEADGDGRRALRRYRLDGVFVGEEDVIAKMDASLEKSSDVLRIQRTKEGFKGAGLVTGEQMRKTLDYAVEKTAESVGRILSGEAQILPARVKKWTACDRCDYRAVCRFEPNTGTFRTIAPLSAKGFFEGVAMEKEERED